MFGEVFQEYEGADVRVSFDEDVKLTCLKNLSYGEALDPSIRIAPHLVFEFPLIPPVYRLGPANDSSCRGHGFCGESITGVPPQRSGTGIQYTH